MLAARTLLLVHRPRSVVTSSSVAAARCLFSGGAPDNLGRWSDNTTRRTDFSDGAGSGSTASRHHQLQYQGRHDEQQTVVSIPQQQQQQQQRGSLRLTKEQVRKLWDQLGWEKREGTTHGGHYGGGRRSGRRRLRIDPDKFPLELFSDAPAAVAATSEADDEDHHAALAIDVEDNMAQQQTDGIDGHDYSSSAVARNDSEEEAHTTSPERLRQHALDAEAELENVLLRIDASFSSSGDGREKVHAAYNSALNAWSRYQHSLVETAKRQIMEARESAPSPAPRADAGGGGGGPSSVVEMRSELRQTAQQTSALLKRWENDSIPPGDGGEGAVSPPSIEAYRIAIDAWHAVHGHVVRYPDAAQEGHGGGESTTTNGRYEAAEEATALLRRMMDASASSPPLLQLDGRGTLDVDYGASSPPSVAVGRIYDRVIRMWTDDVIGGHKRRRRKNSASARSSDSARQEAEAVLDSARRAAEVLADVERRSAGGAAVVVAGLVGANAVLFAYSRAASDLSHATRLHGSEETALLAKAAAEEAEQILIRMEEERRCRGTGAPSVQEDADTGRRSAVGTLGPNLTSYRAVLMAWAALGTPAGAYRAEKILRRAEEGIVSVDIASYRTVLNAFARISHLDGGQAAGKALEILARMEGEMGLPFLLRSLDDTSALAGSNEAKESMDEDLTKARVSSTRTYASGSKIVVVRPDVTCYSIVLDAIARMRSATSRKIVSGASKPQERAPLANAVLLRMEQAHALGRIEAPELYDYGRVITAWSRHESDVNQAANEAEAVLERLEGSLFVGQDTENPAADFHDSLVASVTVWYNTTMGLLAKSSVPDAAQRAEEIIQRMEAMYRDYQSPPLTEVKAKRRIPVVPDFRSYQSCISAWANSVDIQDVTRAIHARELLKRMESMHILGSVNADGEQAPRGLAGKKANSLARPHVTCYNAAIKSCAFVAKGGDVGKRAALAVAEEIYEDLSKCKYDKPNAATYGRMIEAYARLLLPGMERYESIEEVFQECCKQGQVSCFVLKMLHFGASKVVVRKLVGQYSNVRSNPERKKLRVEPSDLPLAWTKNTATTSQQ